MPFFKNIFRNKNTDANDEKLINHLLENASKTGNKTRLELINKYVRILRNNPVSFKDTTVESLFADASTDNMMFEYYSAMHLILNNGIDGILNIKNLTPLMLHAAAVTSSLNIDEDSQLYDVIVRSDYNKQAIARIAVDADNGYPDEFIIQDVLASLYLDEDSPSSDYDNERLLE